MQIMQIKGNHKEAYQELTPRCMVGKTFTLLQFYNIVEELNENLGCNN